MTDEKQLDGQPLHSQKGSIEVGEHTSDSNDQPADAGPLPPGLNAPTPVEKSAVRGIRRPSEATADTPVNHPAPFSLISGNTTVENPKLPDQSNRPLAISPFNDVLPTDRTFHSLDDEDQAEAYVSTPDELLGNASNEVENSLRILRGENKNHDASPDLDPETDDPLVLIQRRRTWDRNFNTQLPAPLPVADRNRQVVTTDDHGCDDNRRSAETPHKTIETVADDAVQIMSRSMDAAGGNSLNVEVAREIRMNLTQLLAEWQSDEQERRVGHNPKPFANLEKPLT